MSYSKFTKGMIVKSNFCLPYDRYIYGIIKEVIRDNYYEINPVIYTPKEYKYGKLIGGYIWRFEEQLEISSLDEVMVELL